jgi:hypothetical protein
MNHSSSTHVFSIIWKIIEFFPMTIRKRKWDLESPVQTSEDHNTPGTEIKKSSAMIRVPKMVD